MIVEYRCPQSGERLERRGERLVAAASGTQYSLRDGVPVLLSSSHAEGARTQVTDSFAFKWNRVDLGFDPVQFNRYVRPVTLEELALGGEADLDLFFGNKIVLDAGVGNGMKVPVYGDCASEVHGIDLTEAIFIAARHLAKRSHFFPAQADLMRLPFADEQFDTIVSNGVLHHTPNTRRALHSVLRKLKVGGHVLFYVYIKKAPLREFADDYLRDRISRMEPEVAFRQLLSLTRLAQALSELKAEIVVPEDIDLLQIRAGRYDLQRLIYYHCFKFFWNDALNLEQNNLVNFDWYHPQYAWRHTEDEVRGWLEELHCSAVRLNVLPSGIACIARKDTPTPACCDERNPA